MKSVADQLRERTAQAVRDLPVAERMALALSLGDADLDMYVRASGLDRTTAVKQLRAQRARGRATPSRSADPGR